jgi:malate dehydrogenase (oxaloacetate-decarboxylating)(NADP+)
MDNADRRTGARRGLDILRDPLLNKGTAFTEQERAEMGLRGLLPPHVLTQAEQAQRFLGNLRRLSDPLDKFVALNSLHDRNEALFFRILCDHIDEMQPIVYTPVVGLACQKFGQIYQRPRGMFIDINDRGNIANVLRNWPYPAAIIVVTDGERILGLGDLGANGMGIPVGKLSLYTACAGIHPRLCLPITLDVGTNNDALRNDLNYVGLRQRRVTGAEYDAFVDEFMLATQEVFPGALVQFEDFANHNAFRLLEKYRDRIGTGRVVFRAAHHRRAADRAEGVVPWRGRSRHGHRRFDRVGDGRKRPYARAGVAEKLAGRFAGAGGQGPVKAGSA